MQILFFFLIPVGIILLAWSIRFLNKTLSGNIILEIPYYQKYAEFILDSPGTYSIWHRGQYFRKAPLDEFAPIIINKSRGMKIELSSLLLRLNKSNRKTARMELYRFSAPAGEYILELNDGSSISDMENRLIRRLPVRMVDYDKYFIQVRESQPVFHMLIGIVLTVLSGFLIIGGFITGIFAEQLFIK